MRPRTSRAGLGVTLAVCVPMTLTGAFVPAEAHAALTGSSPAEGATVTQAPTKVILRYDENIRDPSVVIVSGPDGKRVDHDGTRVLNNTASVDVALRRRGGYTVSYRVISADGHPVSGTVQFAFEGKGAPVSTARAAPSARPYPTSHTTAWVAGGGAALVAVLAVLVMPGRRRKRHGSGVEQGAP